MLRHLSLRGVLALAAVISLACIGLSAQAQTPQKADVQKPAPAVKGVRGVPIRSVDGRDNFDAYCAVCHGPDGKGNGPAAPAMKVTVPDLTMIAARNQGKFDSARIQAIIRGTDRTTKTPAHGVEDMPIWGDVFRSDDRGTNTLRIGNLVSYLQSIQAK